MFRRRCDLAIPFGTPLIAQARRHEMRGEADDLARAIERWRAGHLTLALDETLARMRHRDGPGPRFSGELPPAGGQLVIAARRPLFLAGDALLLPPRSDAAFGVEPAQDW